MILPVSDPYVNSLGMALRPIPAGRFTMGSDDVPLDPLSGARRFNITGDWDEWPRHEVTISRQPIATTGCSC